MEISEKAYKLAKEAHVANCTGGSTQEINMMCASLVVRNLPTWGADLVYLCIICPQPK